MKTYQLAIIGYGGMAGYHANGILKDNKQINVFGTFDIRHERQVASIEDGYVAFESLDELLDEEAIDIVLVATPNEVHKELCIKALRAKKHVVCEKPVTMNTEELKEILAVAEEENCVFMVHQNRRWDEDFLIIKSIYDQRLIGDVFEIESRVQGANGIPGDWRHLKVHGGGMILDWGVHLLDQLLVMVQSKMTSVYANTSMILGDDVDDGFHTTITFENGVKAILEVGTTNFIQLPRWYVKGCDGAAIIENWNLDGHMITRNQEGEIIPPKPIQAGQGLTKTMAPPSENATIKHDLPAPEIQTQSFYENLVSVIEGEKEARVKNDEVMRVMHLIEMIFKSAETNTVIKDFDLI
ncbi:MAG: Gfo/Idh/MocA family oxidoreductase [Turicibacter sp.]